MKGLRRFLLSALVILCAVIVADIILGKIMNWMLPQINPKTAIGKTCFALDKVNTPVVIVGSSRASHHYVTRMIEDSLGLDAYNVGRDGCYFSDNICIINSILDRYSPEIIIWELSDNPLYVDGNDPLESLYPYYGENAWVTDIINMEEDTDIRLCLKSALYRYNSQVLRICLRWLQKNDESDIDKGYDPLAPKKWIVASNGKDEKTQEREIDTIKMQLFVNVVDRIKMGGVNLIVLNSPVYSDDENIKPVTNDNFMREILTENGFCYLDNRCLGEFICHPEYFNDRTHLNRIGAEVYTRIFLEQLKGIKSK